MIGLEEVHGMKDQHVPRGSAAGFRVLCVRNDAELPTRALYDLFLQ